MNLHYRPGMRSVKTVIAVFFTLVICFCLKRMQTITVAAISAIVCMRQNNQETLRFSLMRLLGTALGGLIGFAAAFSSAYIPYYSQGVFLAAVPLFLIFDLYLCNVFHLQQASTISCTVVLLVALNFERTQQDAVFYALNRAIDTFIGAGVSLLVDLAIAPAKAKPAAERAEEDHEVS